MKIEIECEWDEDQLAMTELRFEGKPIRSVWTSALDIGAAADRLCEAIARWKIEQNKRNVSQ